jgi:hypothetical protein
VRGHPVFAFLIGKWEGRGKTRLPDGKVAEYSVAWIGRYILDPIAGSELSNGMDPLERKARSR